MVAHVYDLHCHSTASDGALKPEALVQLAIKKSINTLALTDHDTTAGLKEAKDAADWVGINLVPGIEISTRWNDKCFHIVGLNINPEHPNLQKGIQGLQKLRFRRAELMAEQLEKYGAGKNIGAWVLKSAGGGMVTRTHFAQYLVRHGYGKNIPDIFKHFLVREKPGFVATRWADLDDIVAWINESGGVAVLAHPMRYKLNARGMRNLLPAFKTAGGKAIEVVCGSNSKQDTLNTAELARAHGLFGSVGSDFHNPENTWITLGKLAPLPKGIEPVWSFFRNYSAHP